MATPDNETKRPTLGEFYRGLAYVLCLLFFMQVSWMLDLGNVRNYLLWVLVVSFLVVSGIAAHFSLRERARKIIEG
jgi:hypothetical protein